MAVDPTYQPKVYRKQGGDEIVVADGGVITVQSGGSIVAESGAVMTLPDIALDVADLALTTGSIIIGVANKAAALDAKGDGKILIGNGTTAAMQSIGTDATLSNAGALTIANNAITAAKINADAVVTAKIQDGAVTSGKLAAGAGVAALLTAGLGGSHSVLKAEAAVHTVVALNAKARACIVLVVIDETYAAVGGVAPTIKVGETDDDNACFDVAVITNQAAGTVLAFAFTNTANKAIIITTTAATVDATGGCSVTVLAIPTT